MKSTAFKLCTVAIRSFIIVQILNKVLWRFARQVVLMVGIWVEWWRHNGSGEGGGGGHAGSRGEIVEGCWTSKGHWIFLRHSVSLVWVWYLRCNISLSVQNTLHFLFWGHDLSIPPSPPSHALLTSWLIFCILLCVFPLLHSPNGAAAVQVCRRRTEEEAESEQVPSKRPTVASRRRGKRYRS